MKRIINYQATTVKDFLSDTIDEFESNDSPLGDVSPYGIIYNEETEKGIVGMRVVTVNIGNGQIVTLQAKDLNERSIAVRKIMKESSNTKVKVLIVDLSRHAMKREGISINEVDGSATMNGASNFTVSIPPEKVPYLTVNEFAGMITVFKQKTINIVITTSDRVFIGETRVDTKQEDLKDIATRALTSAIRKNEGLTISYFYKGGK